MPLELAVVGMDDDEAERFTSRGWRLRSASDLSTTDVYRDYIRGSLGEFTVAKEYSFCPSRAGSAIEACAISPQDDR